MKNKVPFREGLFEEKDGKGYLLGVKCRQCGQIIFPHREACLNCLGNELEPIRLSRNGTLYTYTIVHMPSDHFPPPYAVGWIDMPEGLKIFSQIRGWKECPLKTGMDMDLRFEKLWDEEEQEIIGYVFRPSVIGGGI